jgi:hypothetical protein
MMIGGIVARIGSVARRVDERLIMILVEESLIMILL